MIKGIFSSAAGMLPRTLKLEIIANNIANIDTTGFKKDNAFIQVMDHAKVTAFNQSGVGDLAGLDAKEFTDFSQGTFRTTHNSFDMALLGKGFFTIETPQGTRYTRNGNFSLAPDGSIQTQQGYAVIGTSGPIKIAGLNKLSTADISISQEGEIVVDKTVVGKLRIVDFPEPYKLEKFGNSFFAPKDNIAPTDAEKDTVVRQGMLEESNVDAIFEMISMIELSNGYESVQKLTQIQDGSLGAAMDVGRI